MHPQIGLFPANPWGFHDMHGNVSEWCSDWNSEIYFTAPVTNPTGATSGTQKIIRGASAYFLDLKASGRFYANTSHDHDSHGLRVALKSENTMIPKYEPEVFTPEQENHFIPSAANMEMIWISPGKFDMGSPESEKGRKDDEEMHEVTLTSGFYLGKYEVTNAQYEAVMADNTQGIETSLRQAKGPDFPAEWVRWSHLQSFIEILNDKEKSSGRLKDGWAFTLPSEAEWEYACRAGTNTAYYWGDLILADYANWGSDQAKPVGQYPANPWGLHDMHGNVAEITNDPYAKYPLGPVTDPTIGVWNWGHTRVYRGGSYKQYYSQGKWFKVRSAARSKQDIPINSIPGFRLALKDNLHHANDDHDERGSTELSPSTNNRIIELNSTINLEMIWVEPGEFTMGNPEGEALEDETPHKVNLTKGFYLGKHEVTQQQYEAVVMQGSNGVDSTPSYYSGNPNRPVESISWDDIQIFLTLVNQNASLTLERGWSFVLPTEAEWEYACRAGTTTRYSGGDFITYKDANYKDNYGPTRNVGEFSPNQWGFFDMHGNVWEWCADWYGDYPSNSAIDPTGARALGSLRVIRGGAWTSYSSSLKSTRRDKIEPSSRYRDTGFRLALKKNLTNSEDITNDKNNPNFSDSGGNDNLGNEIPNEHTESPLITFTEWESYQNDGLTSLVYFQWKTD